MRSYEVARKTFGAIEFVGWSLVVIGLFVAIGLAGSVSQYAPAGAGFLAMIPGFAASVVGLVLVGHAQYWRAGVDSAEYNQQSLKIARESLEISRQSLRGGQPEVIGFAAKITDKAKKTESNGASYSKVPTNGPEAVGSEVKALDQEREDKQLPEPSSNPLVALGRADGSLIYEGQVIEVRGGAFWVGTNRLENLATARQFINAQRNVALGSGCIDVRAGS